MLSTFWALLDAAPELRMAQLAQNLKARFGGEVAETAASDSTLAAIVTAIIGDLSEMSRDDRAALILVYLPTLPDYLDPSHSADSWRERIRVASDRAKNVWYLDLITELRRLPPDSVISMFIPYRAEGHNHGGWGHLTPRGNRWVADLLFEHLGRILIR